MPSSATFNSLLPSPPPSSNPPYQTLTRKSIDLDRPTSSKKRKHQQHHRQPDLHSAIESPIKKHKRDQSKTRPTPPSDSTVDIVTPQSSEASKMSVNGLDITAASSSAASSSSSNSMDTNTLSSPFRQVTHSSYVPIPPIALSTDSALQCLVTKHLSPLTLTYYPPLRGVVMAFSDAEMSSIKPDLNNEAAPANHNAVSEDQKINVTLANCADQDGLSYVWLTASFCIFKPEIGDELEGELTVCSNGFIGLQAYNYFQVGIGAAQIPKSWKWVDPWVKAYEDAAKGTRGKYTMEELDPEPKMPKDFIFDCGIQREIEIARAPDDNTPLHFRDEIASLRDQMGPPGYFIDGQGQRVRGTVRFRVIDYDNVPGPSRETLSLHLDGTLVSKEDEIASTKNTNPGPRVRNRGTVGQQAKASAE